MGGWKEFWDGLFAHAKGLKSKNVILLALAALAFLGMIAGVSPYAAIGAVVVFYCLDPILKLTKSAIARRNKVNDRAIVETNFRTHLQRKRRELRSRSDQPELPLSPPPPDRLEPPP